METQADALVCLCNDLTDLRLMRSIIKIIKTLNELNIFVTNSFVWRYAQYVEQIYSLNANIWSTLMLNKMIKGKAVIFRHRICNKAIYMIFMQKTKS